MRNNYNNWMSESVKELTAAGRIRRPSYETVVDWVNRSWNSIDINLIKRSFKCCGISNKRDGTEDDWIFDYNRLEQKNSNEEIGILDEGNDNEGNGNEGNDNEDNHYDEEEEDYNNDWEN